MRRIVLSVLPVLLAVAVLSPPASAQAPTPRVTITGQIDNILNLNRNMNNTTQDRTVRGGQASDGDKEFGAYTRGRWDIIGQLGKARAVMGWEIDMHYGGFGATNADTCVTTLFSGTAAGNCGSRGDGSSGGLDADTDVRVPIELKWMYVEFPLMGPGSLLPFIPIEATARVGGQPFSLGMKPQQLADADFAGFRAELKFTPDVRLIALYHQIEENFSGPRSRVNNLATAGSANSTGWDRGDDFGVILKLDVEPFKGLRVSPLVAYQYLDGTTAGSIHTPVGGYPVTGVAYAPDIAATTALQRHCLGNLGVSTLGDKCRPTFQNRYWVGVDARLDQGPFYVWPTIIWQGGDFHRLAQNGPVVAVAVAEPGRQGVVSGRTDAWLLDVETGYRRGPLYLQGRFAYGTGNKPKDNLNQVRNYWEQFQHGGGYFNGFGEVNGGASISYLSPWNGTGNANPYSISTRPSYDRYGLIRASAKATYSVTPALDIWTSVTPIWTAEKVDTNLIATSTGLAIPVGAGTARACDRACGDGDERYIGTDLSGGITYRFAPGLTFDLGGGFLFAGHALDRMVDVCAYAGSAPCGQFAKYRAKDSYSVSTRIRYAF